jgi:hypothetical protein
MMMMMMLNGTQKRDKWGSSSSNSALQAGGQCVFKEGTVNTAHSSGVGKGRRVILQLVKVHLLFGY